MTEHHSNGPRDERRRSPDPTRFLVGAALGVLLLGLSAWQFTAVPDRLADEDAYAAAPACPDGTTWSDPCTTTVQATVRGTREEARGKGRRHFLILTEAGSDTARHVRMGGAPGPVLASVRPGDVVTTTYWRGEIRRVGIGGAVEETHASPLDDWRSTLGIGLAALPVGLLFLWLSLWAGPRLPRRRPAEPGGHHPWALPTTLCLAAVLLGGVGFLAAGIGDDVPGALLMMACGAPPALALGGVCVLPLRRRLRRAEDTSDVVPVGPDGKRCLRASLRGDVPYSVDGFDHLVVGDGRPAATPDPWGNVARRDLPESLTVEGVRAFRLGDDPDAWPRTYQFDGVVITCRDGAEPVLIATRRRDAPLILGALREAWE
ncbi:hypothetical protein ACWDX6_16030 [Streptomyces sp. NPDC003027]